MPKNRQVKQRIDTILVDRGMATSREQAKRMILAGVVKVAGIHLPKPGQLVDATIDIEVLVKDRYVSRGGLKLEKALEEFKINLKGRVCTDIGASTGGFTDCMLQHGARRVYSVDVGVSQMHEKLQNDPRVTLLEHKNARELIAEDYDEPPQFVAIDVSFISILRVTEALSTALPPLAEGVFLIKPQFEAGKQVVSKSRGVIRDEEVHREVLFSTLCGLARQGWKSAGLISSPIQGGSGNTEFLCHAHLTGDNEVIAEDIAIAVDEALQCARAQFS